MLRLLPYLAVPALYPIAQRGRPPGPRVECMFRLVADDETRLGDVACRRRRRTMPSIEAARLGAAELLREDRILKIMIVRNEFPGGFVEWIDR